MLEMCVDSGCYVEVIIFISRLMVAILRMKIRSVSMSAQWWSLYRGTSICFCKVLWSLYRV